MNDDNFIRTIDGIEYVRADDALIVINRLLKLLNKLGHRSIHATQLFLDESDMIEKMEILTERWSK